MLSDVARWLRIASDLHDEGRLTEAEPYYEKVLDATPDDAAALGRLGALALQTGRPSRAAELLRRAAALNPETAQFRDRIGGKLMRPINFHTDAVEPVTRKAPRRILRTALRFSQFEVH